MVTATDRVRGANSSKAYKAPCRVATSGNITLSGLQTIGGIALAEGDRVLVKSQTTATENGIYIASTGTWLRAPDFDGVYDVAQGTLVGVPNDDTPYLDIYSLVTESPVIGASTLSFLLANGALSGTYTAPFTGSVARSITERLGDLPSLLDFGPAGIGNSTADTTAFLAAADLGTDIVVPPGLYLVDDEIVAKDGTRFHGQGHWGGAAGSANSARDTIVRANAAMDAVFRFSSTAVGTEPTDPSTRTMRAVGLTGMVVDANGLADFGVYGVRANLLSHFERLVCIGAKEYGFWAGLMWTCVLKDIMCRGNEKNGFGIGKNLYSWAGTTNCNNCVLMNITGQFNGTADTFNEGVLEDEGIGVELYLHRGNTCININAEFNDGPGIYVQSTSVPNTFIGGYTENNGQSATATKEWDLWVEGESAGASANLTFQGLIVIDDVKITGTEPAEAGAYSPLEFRDCFIDGDIDASWNNFKLIDTRHNGTFPNQKPIGRLFSAKVGDTLYKDTRVQGVAEAWGKIDGTGTPSIAKGLNIASITDNGTGDYWVNFTRNMPSTEYCVVCSGNNMIVGVQTQEVSRVRINVRDNAGTLTDGVFNLMVFSDD